MSVTARATVAQAPGSRSAILVSESGGWVHISIIEATRPREIVRLPAEQFIRPYYETFITLSPDERYLTYLTATGASSGQVSFDGATLWLVDLRTDQARPAIAFGDDLWPTPPLWSPDSTRLAFVRVSAESESRERGSVELWGFDTGTSEEWLLVRHSSFTTELFYSSLPADLRWMPSATTVAYHEYDLEQGLRIAHTFGVEEGDHRMQIAPLTGSEQQAASDRSPGRTSAPVWSQGDPRWGDAIMQTCGLTIRRAGCAVTSTAMLFAHYGVSTNPGILNQCLGDFACPLYWGTAATRCSADVVDFAGWPSFDWPTLEQEVQSGRPAILGMCQGGCSRRTHFVLVVDGKGTSPAAYRVHDPADGQTKALSALTSAGWTLEWLRLYEGLPTVVPQAWKVYLPTLSKQREPSPLR
jgi:hypothetical protein